MTTELSIAHLGANDSTWECKEDIILDLDYTPSLREAVTNSVKSYLNCLGDHDAINLYQMVLEEVESSLFQVVIDFAKSNKTRASAILGLNRATLRKKLLFYGLL